MSLIEEALSLEEIQRIDELKRKVKKPEDSLKRRDEEIKRPREGLNPDKEDFKPIKCFHYGFEKVYKNGTYKRKRKRGSLAKGELKIRPEGDEEQIGH